MKPITTSKELEIPEGVDVTIKSRRFTVTGPRGKLTKDLSHIAADMYLAEDAETGTKKLKVDIHFSSRKGLSSLRTVISHVSNMIVGVTVGFKCVPDWPSVNLFIQALGTQSPRTLCAAHIARPRVVCLQTLLRSMLLV
jgi:hypothetical protein